MNNFVPVAFDKDRVYILNMDAVDSIALYADTKRAYVNYTTDTERDTFEGDDFTMLVAALNVKFGWKLYE